MHSLQNVAEADADQPTAHSPPPQPPPPSYRGVCTLHVGGRQATSAGPRLGPTHLVSVCALAPLAGSLSGGGGGFTHGPATGWGGGGDARAGTLRRWRHLASLSTPPTPAGGVAFWCGPPPPPLLTDRRPLDPCLGAGPRPLSGGLAPPPTARGERRGRHSAPTGRTAVLHALAPPSPASGGCASVGHYLARPHVFDAPRARCCGGGGGGWVGTAWVITLCVCARGGLSRSAIGRRAWSLWASSASSVALLGGVPSSVRGSLSV